MSELHAAELEVIAKRAYADPVYFCRFFLEKHFSEEIPWVHRGILAILTGRTQFLLTYGEMDKIISNFVYNDANADLHHIFQLEGGRVKMARGRHTLVLLPRGFAKTTIAGIAVPLYRVVYATEPFFFLYVSHAAPHAWMQTENVKAELEANERLRTVFGNKKPEMRDPEVWSKGFFETTTGCAMAARGQGGQVRGLLHKGKRPSEVIVDDLEDGDSVRTEERRQLTRHWFYSDLLPVLPELDPNAKFTALGTLLHQQSLLSTLKSDPTWTVVQFGARDLDGDLLWARNMDEKKLEAKKKQYAAAGQLHAYYLEYFNDPRAPESQVFDITKIIYDKPHGKNLKHVIYADPAYSKSRYADYYCIAVLCMNEEGIMWVRKCWLKQGASQREAIDKYFEYQVQYETVRAGIENTAGQAGTEQAMREEMFRKHQYFELEGVTNKSRKVDRIQSSLPQRINSGYLHFEERFPILEMQLDEFRPDDSHVHDDGPDGVAGALTLLDKFAAMAAGVDLEEDVYEPLEKVFGGEWRQY